MAKDRIDVRFNQSSLTDRSIIDLFKYLLPPQLKSAELRVWAHSGRSTRVAIDARNTIQLTIGTAKAKRLFRPRLPPYGLPVPCRSGEELLVLFVSYLLNELAHPFNRVYSGIAEMGAHRDGFSVIPSDQYALTSLLRWLQDPKKPKLRRQPVRRQSRAQRFAAHEAMRARYSV